ncbi:hypothetical protein QYM36_006459, partial [Artemia franciscana]
EGREDREKPGRKQKRQNPFASTTNKEKQKKKGFMMIRNKAKGKKIRSFKEKQVTCRLFWFFFAELLKASPLPSVAVEHGRRVVPSGSYTKASDSVKEVLVIGSEIGQCYRPSAIKAQRSHALEGLLIHF